MNAYLNPYLDQMPWVTLTNHGNVAELDETALHEAASKDETAALVVAILDHTGSPLRTTLSAKIGRHLRRKGWKTSKKSGLWIDPKTSAERSLASAVRIQIGRE